MNRTYPIQIDIRKIKEFTLYAILVIIIIFCSVYYAIPTLFGVISLLFLIIYTYFSIKNFTEAILFFIVAIPFLHNGFNIHTPFFDIRPFYIFVFPFSTAYITIMLKRDFENKNTNAISLNNFRLITILFITSFVLSSILSSKPLLSLKETIQYLIYVGFVFFAIFSVRNKDNIVLICKVWFWSISILTSVTLLLYCLKIQLGIPRFLIEIGDTLSFSIEREATYFKYFTSGIQYNRLTFGLGGLNPDGTASLILIAFFIGAGILISQKKLLRKSSLLYIFFLVVLLLGLLFTFARFAWLSFLIGLILIFILIKKFRGKTIFIIFFLVSILSTNTALLTRSKEIIGYEAEGSRFRRIEFYKYTLGCIKKYPIFGVGPGILPYKIAKDFESWKGKWLRLDVESPSPHCAVFELWAEVGTFGFIFFIGLLILSVIYSLNVIKKAKSSRNYSSLGFITGLIVSLISIVFYSLSLVGLHIWLWILLGLTIGASKILINEAGSS